MAKGRGRADQIWLSTLPRGIAFRDLVDITKLRWRIERDYQELKQEVGLGHFEGRGWRGFHHHATLCIAAYGFLISERETIPPQALPPPRSSRNLPFPNITDPERRPCGLNVTSRIRLRPCADVSSSRWSKHYRDVPVGRSKHPAIKWFVTQ